MINRREWLGLSLSAIIRIRDLSREYRMGSELILALRGVTLEIVDDPDCAALLAGFAGLLAVLAEKLGLSHQEFINMGRVTPDNGEELYGLTPLAVAFFAFDESGYFAQQDHLGPALSDVLDDTGPDARLLGPSVVPA